MKQRNKRGDVSIASNGSNATRNNKCNSLIIFELDIIFYIKKKEKKINKK